VGERGKCSWNEGVEGEKEGPACELLQTIPSEC